ncbi:MAG: LysR substrate-binding domain-containing protein [Pseudomonadota bacterium]
MKLTLRQLEYLVALADEGHFGRAAERVSVSQPALSQQIREIEANLGVSLVERGPRIRLSRAGLQAVEKAREILVLAGELERITPRLDGLSGSLRLGVIPTVAPYFLPRVLARMSEHAISIQVLEAMTERLLTGVADGAIDAAICAAPVVEQGLRLEPIFIDRFLYAASPNSDAPTPLKPSMIAAERLLLLDDGHCLADQALAVCGLRRETSSLGAASLTTLSRLVAEGYGVTLLPEIAAPVEGHDLSLHRFAEPEPSRTIGLVTRTSSGGQRWVPELVALLRAASDDATDRKSAASVT